MDKYINNYNSFKKTVIYNFNLGDGGIGDCIKFFIYLLQICIKNNYKLFYMKHNIHIEEFLKLKYDKMYITESDIHLLNKVRLNRIRDLKNLDDTSVYIIRPQSMYKRYQDSDIQINIKDVFDFSKEVVMNRDKILSINTDYICIHLRLGDKFLETQKNFIQCPEDVRIYSEAKIFDCIEKNKDKKIIFLCDNHAYRLKLKDKYSNLIITTSIIGHSSLLNTKRKQTLDAVTEFYILTCSKMIYACSHSGFSMIASKFNNIPLIKLY